MLRYRENHFFVAALSMAAIMLLPSESVALSIEPLTALAKNGLAGVAPCLFPFRPITADVPSSRRYKPNHRPLESVKLLLIPTDPPMVDLYILVDTPLLRFSRLEVTADAPRLTAVRIILSDFFVPRRSDAFRREDLEGSSLSIAASTSRESTLIVFALVVIGQKKGRGNRPSCFSAD